MSVKTAAAASRATYALADALQMDLIVNDQKDKLRIVGELEMKFETGGVEFDINPEVIASGVSAKDVWVFLHLRGDLYLWLNHAVDLKELYLWVIDRKLSDMSGEQAIGLINNSSTEFVSSALEKACVAVFKRGVGGSQWTRTDASRVDGRPGRGAEKDSRKDHRGSGRSAPRS